MTYQQQVETVARALAVHDGCDPDELYYESAEDRAAGIQQPTWRDFEDEARAALAALAIHPETADAKGVRSMHTPAPAISGGEMVPREALQKLMRAYVNLLEIGRDRIVMLGGTCDPVDVMEDGDPALREARAALAAAGQKP